MKVIRPVSPSLAVAVAQAIVAAQNNGELTKEQSSIAHSHMILLQDYKVVGYWDPQRKKITDGRMPPEISDLQPGDSIVRDDGTDAYGADHITGKFIRFLAEMN